MKREPDFYGTARMEWMVGRRVLLSGVGCSFHFLGCCRMYWDEILRHRVYVGSLECSTFWNAFVRLTGGIGNCRQGQKGRVNIEFEKTTKQRGFNLILGLNEHIWNLLTTATNITNWLVCHQMPLALKWLREIPKSVWNCQSHVF